VRAVFLLIWMISDSKCVQMYADTDADAKQIEIDRNLDPRDGVIFFLLWLRVLAGCKENMPVERLKNAKRNTQVGTAFPSL
jgi:hypothetical protein